MVSKLVTPLISKRKEHPIKARASKKEKLSSSCQPGASHRDVSLSDNDISTETDVSPSDLDDFTSEPELLRKMYHHHLAMNHLNVVRLLPQIKINTLILPMINQLWTLPALTLILKLAAQMRTLIPMMVVSKDCVTL